MEEPKNMALGLALMTRIPFFIGRTWIRLFSKPRFLMTPAERKAYEKRLWRLS